MSELTLESLGFSKEDLQQRVVDQICEQVMNSTGMDDEGGAHSYPSRVSVMLQAKAKKQIDDALNDFAAKFIVPGIGKYLETLVLQPSSSYGERKGDPQTFLEYLTKRTGEWLSEEVNEEGKARKEDSYSWKKWGIRGVWLVEQQLKDRITSLVVGGVNDTHAAVANAVLQQVKDAIQRTATSIQVSTTTAPRKE